MLWNLRYKLKQMFSRHFTEIWRSFEFFVKICIFRYWSIRNNLVKYATNYKTSVRDIVPKFRTVLKWRLKLKLIINNSFLLWSKSSHFCSYATIVKIDLLGSLSLLHPAIFPFSFLQHFERNSKTGPASTVITIRISFPTDAVYLNVITAFLRL